MYSKSKENGNGLIILRVLTGTYFEVFEIRVEMWLEMLGFRPKPTMKHV
jgi:hypothetical protein